MIQLAARAPRGFGQAPLGVTRGAVVSAERAAPAPGMATSTKVVLGVLGVAAVAWAATRGRRGPVTPVTPVTPVAPVPPARPVVPRPRAPTATAISGKATPMVAAAKAGEKLLWDPVDKKYKKDTGYITVGGSPHRRATPRLYGDNALAAASRLGICQDCLTRQAAPGSAICSVCRGEGI